MNAPILTRYQSMLAVLAIAIFFTNISHFVFYKGWSFFGPPKIWVIGFVILSIPLIVSQTFNWSLRQWPLLFWCAGYVLLSLVGFFMAPDSEMAWQELRLRAQTVLLLLSLLFVFAHPTALLWASRMVAVCVVAAVLINVFEIFNPMVINDSIGRSAGFYLNPNQAGLALVVGMVLSLPIVGGRYRGLFILLVIVGMVTTISRAGLLVLCLAIGLSLFWRAVKVKQIATAGMLGVVLVVGLLLPRLDAMISYLESVGLSHFVEERVAWFMDPTLGESPYEENTHSRLDAAAEAWERFSQYPFWGHGVGTHLDMAGGNEDRFATVGSHNMYLSYMVDHGILGALIFPLSILAAVWRGRGEAKRIGISFALIMLILGLFSHTILMDTFSLPLFAIMAAITGLSQERQEKPRATSPVIEQASSIFNGSRGAWASRPS